MLTPCAARWRTTDAADSHYSWAVGCSAVVEKRSAMKRFLEATFRLRAVFPALLIGSLPSPLEMLRSAPSHRPTLPNPNTHIPLLMELWLNSSLGQLWLNGRTSFLDVFLSKIIWRQAKVLIPSIHRLVEWFKQKECLPSKHETTVTQKKKKKNQFTFFFLLNGVFCIFVWVRPQTLILLPVPPI
jgi:hypothetical protein